MPVRRSIRGLVLTEKVGGEILLETRHGPAVVIRLTVESIRPWQGTATVRMSVEGDGACLSRNGLAPGIHTISIDDRQALDVGAGIWIGIGMRRAEAATSAHAIPLCLDAPRDKWVILSSRTAVTRPADRHCPPLPP